MLGKKTKTTNETIKNYVYNILKDSIINARLIPGVQVSEQELADKLEVSRTPVREALIHLHQEELVEIIPQKGTYISKINEQSVEESRYMREILEVEITKLAAEVFPESYLLLLEENLHSQELYLKQKNYEKLFQYDNDFHRIIYEGTNKMRIWESIQNISGQLNRVRIMALILDSEEIWNLIYAEHKEIFNKIKNHEKVGLAEILIRHLERGKTHIKTIKEQYTEYF
ncbi:MAG: GntR family transcriptional regulator [Fusobacteriales bacterium]|jgi:DNA-binding GntR family transcriptional regulator|nr:GntR family transcriptional regulator [Fusobacteriales bacterium]